jgi:hypothetical protein
MTEDIRFADNMRRLKNIEKEDPILWKMMQNIADRLAINSNVIINDHTSAYITPKHVTICQVYIDGKLLKRSDIAYYGEIHPVAWVFPGPLFPEAQCKNPLYIAEGTTHLTRCSTGYQLSQRDAIKLLNGEMVEQTSLLFPSNEEINFTVPIDAFVNVLH